MHRLHRRHGLRQLRGRLLPVAQQLRDVQVQAVGPAHRLPLLRRLALPGAPALEGCAEARAGCVKQHHRAPRPARACAQAAARRAAHPRPAQDGKCTSTTGCTACAAPSSGGAGAKQAAGVYVPGAGGDMVSCTSPDDPTGQAGACATQDASIPEFTTNTLLYNYPPTCGMVAADQSYACSHSDGCTAW